ncbi:DUF1361 domain-containing protein [Paenibacillus sedimenti]|uniref:DUF1361 domain-containing protein n=1 Tax=Paenibacillus sedimenti TaxID=2770274 RepID=A0A926QMD8_9BACL|nr:DUF1361 domain-containing protein [Paenibacillus sedimenti]MBD0384866.1 DUF1361 domain-containing protein [Paenibacillus sedimenti]
MEKLNALNYPKKIIIVIALGIASLICLTNVYNIRLPSGVRPYLFIFWDTFLAWVPVIIAVLLDLIYIISYRIVRSIMILLLGAAWFFFFPNSPYLVTDLLHVFVRYSYDPTQRFWTDMEFWKQLFTLSSIAFLGVLLGSYSLYSVQRLVRRSYGMIVSWVFALIVLILSSFGIYIGRFVRWNSWDVLTRPGYILKETYVMLTDSNQLGHIVLFCKFMFIILVISYIPIYLMTRLEGESRDL